MDWALGKGYANPVKQLSSSVVEATIDHMIPSGRVTADTHEVALYVQSQRQPRSFKE